MTETEREAQTRALEKLRYQAELRAKARLLTKRKTFDLSTLLTALAIGLLGLAAYGCIVEAFL
jgi:hypothetical protein